MGGWIGNGFGDLDSIQDGALRDVFGKSEGKSERLLVGNIPHFRYVLSTIIDHQRHAKITIECFESLRALIDDPDILNALHAVNLHSNAHDPMISLSSTPRLKDY